MVKNMAKQRAKLLTEHAKLILTKDEELFEFKDEIKRLHKKMGELKINSTNENTKLQQTCAQLRLKVDSLQQGYDSNREEVTRLNIELRSLREQLQLQRTVAEEKERLESQRRDEVQRVKEYDLDRKALLQMKLNAELQRTAIQMDTHSKLGHCNVNNDYALVPAGQLRDCELNSESNITLNTSSQLATIKKCQVNKNKSLSVFLAKYDYNPMQCSPNESPECELTLVKDDYIIVSGTIDEDGFYKGELVNGKRGLVPSNYIEQVPMSDENQLEESTYSNLSHCNIGQNLVNFVPPSALHSANSSVDRVQMAPASGGPLTSALTSNRMLTSTASSLSSHKLLAPNFAITCIDDSFRVPYPSSLTIEKQLATSVLISWTEPKPTIDPVLLNLFKVEKSLPTLPHRRKLIDQTPRSREVSEYRIYLDDDQLKATVKVTERRKALLEGIRLNRKHRISVRCVTTMGDISAGSLCTITLGKAETGAPHDLSIANVRPSSAEISWMPSDSSLCHVIKVNGSPDYKAPTGTCRYKITGLRGGSEHEVSIYAVKADEEDDDDNSLSKLNQTSSLLFHTPSGGL